jgi:hypothetical protein
MSKDVKFLLNMIPMEDKQDPFVAKKIANSSEDDVFSGDATPNNTDDFFGSNMPKSPNPTGGLLTIPNSNIHNSKSSHVLKKSATLGGHQLNPWSQRREEYSKKPARKSPSFDLSM